MNNNYSTREELITQLEALRKEHESLKILYEKDISSHKETEDKLALRNSEFAAINLLNRKIAESLSLELVVSAAIEGLSQTVKTDIVFIFLVDGEKLNLKGINSEVSRQLLGEIPVHRVG